MFRLVCILALLAFLCGCDRGRQDTSDERLEKLAADVRELKQLKYDVEALRVELAEQKKSSSAPAAVSPSAQTPAPAGSGEQAIVKTVFSADGSHLDDPYLGSNSAPAVIFAFVSFQSTTSKKFLTDTLPALQKDVIDSGQVRLILRDFPLNSHAFGRAAAAALHCAGEQGRYWEALGKLEQHMPVESSSFELLRSDEKLSGKKFDQCIKSKRYEREIDRDIAEAERIGVQGVPAFFIGKEVGQGSFEGYLVRGAQPLEIFKKTISRAVGRQ